MPDVRAQSRTRVRKVTVHEYRCVVCGRWRTASQPALTCSAHHRVTLSRMLARGERPPYAA